MPSLISIISARPSEANKSGLATASASKVNSIFSNTLGSSSTSKTVLTTPRYPSAVRAEFVSCCDQAEYIMELLDFPNELLQRVTGFVHPLDLVAFVKTCQQIQKNAGPRLEQHRAMQAKYRKISVITDEKEGRFFKHPIDVIHEIQCNPWLVTYIEEVAFFPMDDRERYRDDEMEGGLFFNENAEKLYDQLDSEPIELASCIGLTTDEQETWTQEIQQGGHSVTFAVLLTILPYIRTLVLCAWPNQWRPYLDKIFIHARRCPSTCRCLSHINKIVVEEFMCETDEVCNPNYLNELVFLPTLRKLDVSGFRTDDYSYDYQPSTWQEDSDLVSNVEEVHLRECSPNPSSLSNLVKPMHDLKKFDFTANIYIRPGSYGELEFMRERIHLEAGVLELIDDHFDGPWKIDFKPENGGFIDCVVKLRVWGVEV